jgi:hypothetical protein
LNKLGFWLQSAVYPRFTRSGQRFKGRLSFVLSTYERQVAEPAFCSHGRGRRFNPCLLTSSWAIRHVYQGHADFFRTLQ